MYDDGFDLPPLSTVLRERESKIMHIFDPNPSFPLSTIHIHRRDSTCSILLHSVHNLTRTGGIGGRSASLDFVFELTFHPRSLTKPLCLFSRIHSNISEPNLTYPFFKPLAYNATNLSFYSWEYIRTSNPIQRCTVWNLKPLCLFLRIHSKP
jgi:hypothetical protein